MNYREKIEHLVSLVKISNKTLVLTGAGASTESGIPDFRSQKKGLWQKYNPEEVASLNALKRDPAKFYQLNMQWWRRCIEAQPNATHYGLAQLEKMGWLLGVITQNIDGLHQRAGSKRVWEVHGHLRTCRCFKCGRGYAFSQLESGYICHCGGVLRPDVVLFGDAMPKDYATAEKVMSGCQLLLVVGSSLQVYPVANLPQFARRLVIINHDPTPWDDRADLVLRESSGQVLGDVLANLDDEQGPIPW
ncbi:NAD-dependent deacylase [Peptococcaceae bacterium 1198_IL3148]